MLLVEAQVALVVERAPGRAGLLLDAEYDTGCYELSLEPRPESPQRQRLALVPRTSMMARAFASCSPNRVELKLPPDLTLSLSGRIARGEATIELGGLDIEALDLEVGMGEYRLGFAEPTRQPMQSMRIDASMGDLRLSGLGNASPAELRVEHLMGELSLSLDVGLRGGFALPSAAPATRAGRRGIDG